VVAAVKPKLTVISNIISRMDPKVAEEIARIVASTLVQYQMQTVAKSSSSGRMKVDLPVYNGRISQNVSTWLFQADQAFLSQNIQDEDRLPYIASMLGEAALEWYRNRCKAAEQDDSLIIADWNKFSVEIRKAFQAPHHQQLLRRKLKYLKQTGSVQEYIYEFRNLLGQTEGMGELDKVQYFVDGLKLRTKVEVNYRAPNNLDDAIEIAITYDTAMFGQGRLDFPRRSSSFPQSSGPIPMELDNVQARKPLSDVERENLRRTGSCFFCREKGHIAKYCPKKSGKYQGVSENEQSQ
jgi:hypothetical protein